MDVPRLGVGPSSASGRFIVVTPHARSFNIMLTLLALVDGR
jgi:hypothetical protein